MSPVMLGILRGIGFALLMAGLTYLANAANLTPLVGVSGATIIAAIVLGIEHQIEASSGKALFGVVRTR